MWRPTPDEIRAAIRSAAGGNFFPIDSWPSRERLLSMALSSGSTDGPVGVVIAAARLLSPAMCAELITRVALPYSLEKSTRI